MNRAHQVRPGSSRTDYLGFETACAVRPYDRLIELAPKERNEFVFSVSLCLCGEAHTGLAAGSCQFGT